MSKVLRIGVHILEEAIQSESRLEALAMAIQFKGLFTSSALHSRSYREMKDVFSMGYNKLKRAITNAIEYGYIRKQGNLFIANKISGRNYVKLEFSDFDKSNSNLRIQKELRKAYLVNYLRKREKLEHTVNKARGYGSPRDCKKAIKLLNKYGIDKNSFIGGTSYNRIAEVLGISRNSSIKLIQELEDQGIIRRMLNFVGQEGEVFAYNEKLDGYFLDALQGIHKKRGYLRRMFCPITGEMTLYVQYSNKFQVISEQFKYKFN